MRGARCEVRGAGVDVRGYDGARGGQDGGLPRRRQIHHAGIPRSTATGDLVETSKIFVLICLKIFVKPFESFLSGGNNWRRLMWVISNLSCHFLAADKKTFRGNIRTIKWSYTRT